MTHLRVPKSIWQLLARFRTYFRRLTIWMEVARQVTGESVDDQRTLRRALLHAPFDALKRLDEWRDPQVDQDCRVVTSLGRFNVRGLSDDLYLLLPSREPAVVKEIRRILRPGDFFVDAGANIGAYSVLASRLVGKNGKVIAVEMMPETATILHDHMLLNGSANFEIVRAALSDLDGSTATATVEPGKSGSASIAVHRRGRQVRVRTTTLETVIGDLPRVRLIKMDLEGAEPAAIWGIGKALDRIDAILFEDWGDGSVGEWLAMKEFMVRRLDANNSLAVAASQSGDAKMSAE